jgi:hypothetical protein
VPGISKKRGRINRTDQNQKNRPAPGISKKRGRIKRAGGSGYFQTPQPTWFSLLTSQNK